MRVFEELPSDKREYMVNLFKDCTEEVKSYMNIIELDADCDLAKMGEKCTNIYIILSGKARGIEWPMYEKPYAFKTYGSCDFFGEIECFSDRANYRIGVVTETKCRVLVIPSVYYMEWMKKDVHALFLRTRENIDRLVSQTAEARKFLFLEGRERLILYLVQKYERKHPIPKMLEVKQTRSQISEEIGYCVKTLNRNIRRLEEMKLLQVQKGKIVISEDGYHQMKDYIDRQING